MSICHTYKLFSEGLLASGKLPERLLFPRNLIWVQFKMTKKINLTRSLYNRNNDLQKEFLTRSQACSDSGWIEELGL